MLTSHCNLGQGDKTTT